MKTNLNLYTGLYYFFGIAFDVQILDDELYAAMSGVPKGYEIRMVPGEMHRFRMLSGPLAGAEVEFVMGDDGQSSSLNAGGFELKKISPEELAGLEWVERLQAPEFVLTAEKEEYFSELYRSAFLQEKAAFIDYTLPYPKYEFIQYLMAKDEFIFHGTGEPEIDRFEPIRTSVEIYDAEGRGNLPAVYGTHDGLWSMFFAVVDRGRLAGSIRNGVLYFHNREGEQLAVYNFSVNKDQLADKPYRSGTLYLLPRTTFKRLKMGGEALSNEWASEQPVTPKAKISIDPEDFPFLEQIGGHDDGPMVRAEVLQRQIYSAVGSSASPGEDSRVLEFVEGSDLAEVVGEFKTLSADLMPVVEYEFDPGSPQRLTIRKMPPALIHVFDKDIRKHLEEN